jgi:hypothetical protein
MITRRANSLLAVAPAEIYLWQEFRAVYHFANMINSAKGNEQR